MNGYSGNMDTRTRALLLIVYRALLAIAAGLEVYLELPKSHRVPAPADACTHTDMPPVPGAPAAGEAIR